ncbi:DNA polymerase epsilon subunit 4-like [Varroa jacobsoni]|uniref:Transcription factor CBF/NF-Y/archaeal histone domain-containing protein n=1 Tax=Varroa destructor TaxID=109461 RepID=A0A7M7J3T5_VARDE|nr:DNA polymerase epsilon subunit 4-like [Varroa destructor]XP_022706421.1 DNA polymerase epsilon subunit 4-like [Varroa jacobsoni]
MSEEVGLVSTEEATDVEPQDKSNEKLLKLPFSKIRTIMKLDPDFNGASVEAVFLIAKATELFIEALAKETCNFTQQNKKKTVQKRDVDSAVDSVEAFSFLEGCLE